MMGRQIDRIVLAAIAAAAFYLLFLQAFGSILLSCALAFLCCTLLIHARRSRGEKYPMTRLQAGKLLEQWAYGPDDEAREQIARLLNLPEDSDMLVYLPKHSTATIGTGDVFSAWKSHRGREHIVISAPCHAENRAKTFARTLQSPTVVIIDAAQLIPKLRRSSLPPPHAPRGRQLIQRIRELLLALPGRRPWYKNLLFGILLMLLYLISGNPAYLALSIGTLFLAGVGIRIRA